MAIGNLTKFLHWSPISMHNKLFKEISLISYKHAKQVIQRNFIDLCTHMVPSIQQWEKIADELQKKIKISKKRHNV
jgi:hypothetical protein